MPADLALELAGEKSALLQEFLHVVLAEVGVGSMVGNRGGEGGWRGGDERDDVG